MHRHLPIELACITIPPRPYYIHLDLDRQYRHLLLIFVNLYKSEKSKKLERENHSPTPYHLLLLTSCKKKSCPFRCQQSSFHSLYFAFRELLLKKSNGRSNGYASPKNRGMLLALRIRPAISSEMLSYNFCRQKDTARGLIHQQT